ncbi:hypothetical protein ACHWQZ_G015784 [Mnemiopsis leidyi]
MHRFIILSFIVISLQCLITTTAENIVQNINCFNREDSRGIKYRGFKNTTISGRVCQKWTMQAPNKHSRTPQNYPNGGLGDHNYCRNPDDTPDSGPWCYIGEGTSPRWESCGIPYCDEQCIGLPPEVPGLTTSQSFPVLTGTRVTVTCLHSCSQSGTCTPTILRGDNIITCYDVTQFLYVEKPKCNPPDSCSRLPDISNLRTSTTLPVYQTDLVHVYCETGYTLYGDSVIECVRGSLYRYSNQKPFCRLDECTNLPTSLQKLEITSHTLPVTYSTVVQVKCNHGYTLQGDNTLTCVQGEQFNFSNLPTCIIEICTGPIFVDYLTTTTTFPITHGTVVMVTCDSDYVLSGSYVITCYRDRNYLFASTPKCVDKGTY